ncbi:PRC-barrel domain-containing protein [Sulfitobacter faviae]|uniref:PRC-barrel domain-containing protein n=1 Tax=Sulfitobacter faviae TaxID=1775881 RepID=UPI00398D1A58
MKRTFLKSTVAALALTAGTAFAQTTDTDAGAAAEAEATISGESVTNTANDLTATVEQQAERTAEMSRENSDDYEGTNDPNTTDEILTAPTQGAEFEGDNEVDNEAELTAETDGVTPTTDAEADLAGNADSESNSTLSTDTSGTVTTETDTDLADDEDADFDNETTAEIEGEAETDLDENVASNTEADMETDVTRTDTGMSNAFSGMVVGDLVGLTVVEADGDSIGDVDYVIKTDDGYAAVVGVGGFLGLGEHTVAVPLEEISMAAENDLKLSSWTKAELEAQPEVDEGNIEGLEDDVRLDDAS